MFYWMSLKTHACYLLVMLFCDLMDERGGLDSFWSQREANKLNLADWSDCFLKIAVRGLRPVSFMHSDEKNRRSTCDPTRTKWIRVLDGCITWNVFTNVFLVCGRVQRKPLRLSLSSSLPYESITEESKLDNVSETAVSQRLTVMVGKTSGLVWLSIVSAKLFWSIKLIVHPEPSVFGLFHNTDCNATVVQSRRRVRNQLKELQSSNNTLLVYNKEQCT